MNRSLHVASALAAPAPKKKIPTKEHCLKVAKLLGETEGVIYVRGRLEENRDDTDTELLFRQESNFFYLTGVNQPGFHFVFDLKTLKGTLIAPVVPPALVLWKGLPDSLPTLIQKYDVDAAILASDLHTLLRRLSPPKIYVLDVANASAIAPFTDLFEASSLKPALHASRLIKTAWEIAHIRHITHVSSHAHISLMNTVQFGMLEYELQALFEYECARNGALGQNYLPIIASGRNAATLHYTKNDAELNRADPNMLLLVDAGGEQDCYGTDITRTYPIGGEFSPEARAIYEIVLKMQKAVLALLRPGVFWKDLQQLATHILCRGLINLGILVGDENELFSRQIARAFYPHGLGHSVGLDVHDVGGQQSGIFTLLTELADISQQYLFLLEQPLEAGMVLTVEPGCYFNDAILRSWIATPELAPFFDLDMIDRYRGVGGVRIEDTILITENGYENFTIVPKEINDIEALMAGGHGKWVGFW